MLLVVDVEQRRGKWRRTRVWHSTEHIIPTLQRFSSSNARTRKLYKYWVTVSVHIHFYLCRLFVSAVLQQLDRNHRTVPRQSVSSLRSHNAENAKNVVWQLRCSTIRHWRAPLDTRAMRNGKLNIYYSMVCVSMVACVVCRIMECEISSERFQCICSCGRRYQLILFSFASKTK